MTEPTTEAGRAADSIPVAIGVYWRGRHWSLCDLVVEAETEAAEPLRAQIAPLVKALGVYADPDNWRPDSWSVPCEFHGPESAHYADPGAPARDALADATSSEKWLAEHDAAKDAQIAALVDFITRSLSEDAQQRPNWLDWQRQNWSDVEFVYPQSFAARHDAEVAREAVEAERARLLDATNHMDSAILRGSDGHPTGPEYLRREDVRALLAPSEDAPQEET
jgi:hypothetical protein